MYVIKTNDSEQTFDDLETAREWADEVTQQESMELQVLYRTEDGSEIVALVTTPVPVDQYFLPWQRVETPKHAAPHFEGFVPAYTRKRIAATVYRGEDHTGWRVFDGRTGNFKDVANTKEACALTCEMRQGLQL